MVSRRYTSFIFFIVTVLFFSGFCFALSSEVDRIVLTAENERLLEEISSASFQFFWKEAHPVSGLVRDKTGKDFCSVASLGFSLAALPIGVERGYVSRQAAQDRALKALRTIKKSNAQHNGMYCHFIDFATGNITSLSYESSASSIDTALMVAGAIVAGEYFKGEVKELAEDIFASVNWQSFVDPQQRGQAYQQKGQVYMAWKADDPNNMSGSGQFERPTWDWYTDETLLIVLLGQASPVAEYRLKPETMTNWNRPVGRYKNGQPFIYTYPGTLFTYMFAHCFYDFRAAGVDSLGVDWYENTRRAVKANRDWCCDHSPEFASYGKHLWGITAGSGPNNEYVVLGHEPRGAKADQGKLGTLHPYGAGMSVPFVPDDALDALQVMRNLKVDGRPIWQSPEEGGYGFWDGFNIDQHWVSDQVIGIAQGPMLLLIENARSGLIWKLMMQNNNVRQGLARAGFKGSF